MPSAVNGEVVLPEVEPRRSAASPWYQVLPEALPELWPQYRPFVLSVLARREGSWNEGDILALLLLGKWLLVASDRDGNPASIAILEIQDFPRQRKLIVKCVAGDKADILAGQDFVERHARAMGCHVIEMYARRGWERVLPDYTPSRVILRKELS